MSPIRRGLQTGPGKFLSRPRSPFRPETPAFNGDLRMHDNVLTREIHGTATNYERTNRVLASAIDASAD